jgi:hypothetical protein
LVLSETGEGKVFEEWVEEAAVFGLRFCRSRQKDSALNNRPTGALHIDGVGYTLSVDREVKMEIPDQYVEITQERFIGWHPGSPVGTMMR